MSQVLQLLHAAVKRGNKNKLIAWFKGQESIELPQISTTRKFAAADFQAKLVAFNRLHDWPHAHLHPCFPQFLGMTQHINALLHKSSPFPLMGLVHLQNHISVIKPLCNDDLTIHCRISAIKVHAKGITADVQIDVRQAEQVCLTATSTYLYRVMADVSALTSRRVPVATSAALQTHLPVGKTLHFNPSTGRRYASISGDYNPIHLYRWSAKLLGFKTSMAHGMHVLALLLSRIEKQYRSLNAPYTVSNQFLHPVSLPCELVLQASSEAPAAASNLSFELVNPKASSRKKVLLCATINAVRNTALEE